MKSNTQRKNPKIVDIVIFGEERKEAANWEKEIAITFFQRLSTKNRNLDVKLVVSEKQGFVLGGALWMWQILLEQLRRDEDAGGY